MLSTRQCELARLLTKTETPNVQMREEYEAISETHMHLAVQEVDLLLKEHDMPIDKGWDIMADDFAKVASKYGISSATLFCILMELISK